MADSHQFELSKIEMNIGGIGIYCFDFSTSMTSYGTKEQILESNTKSLRVADGVLEGMRYHLDPLEFYEEELTGLEKMQKKLSNLKY